MARCLDALARQRPHRLLVVDNAADTNTRRVLAEHPSAPEILRLAVNTGYAGGVSRALPVVRTPFVAWLNDDAEPAPDWLGLLEQALDDAPKAAAATSMLCDHGGEVSSTGVALTRSGQGMDTLDGHAVFGFCGGAALLRTDVLRAVGGVPERFFCYYEDTDTSWRLRLAGHAVRATAARVRHLHGASSVLGSSAFHRWNERNRLFTLLRCAPARVAIREITKFAAITCLLPLRRLRGLDTPGAANFRVLLRCRVLSEIVPRLPQTLLERRRIGRRAIRGRAEVWHEWTDHRAPTNTA